MDWIRFFWICLYLAAKQRTIKLQNTVNVWTFICSPEKIRNNKEIPMTASLQHGFHLAHRPTLQINLGHVQIQVGALSDPCLFAEWTIGTHRDRIYTIGPYLCDLCFYLRHHSRNPCWFLCRIDKFSLWTKPEVASRTSCCSKPRLSSLLCRGWSYCASRGSHNSFRHSAWLSDCKQVEQHSRPSVETPRSRYFLSKTAHQVDDVCPVPTMFSTEYMCNPKKQKEDLG